MKIAGRNIRPLRHAHDTTLAANMKYGGAGGGRRVFCIWEAAIQGGAGAA